MSVWTTPSMQAALQGRDVGKVLRLVLVDSGASQTAVANAAGISQSEVSRIVSGRRQVRSLDLTRRIAAAIEMPPAAQADLGIAVQSK
ncbi:MAG: helix-turn-helix transcriptional regulator, partial [Candidatus Dormibacteraceae bacterium]